MAADSRTNGVAPTQQGEKLAKKNYGDEILATLGQQHVLGDGIIRQVLGEYDPDHVSIRDLRRMRRDPIIRIANYYAKALLIRADYEFDCEDPAIRSGMKEIYDNVHNSWMRTGLNMFDFGYQGAVKQYALGQIDAKFEDPDSGEVRAVWDDPVVKPVVIDRPIPIPPEFAKVALKDGHFNGIHTLLGQMDKMDEREPEVPADWALWFVNEFEEEHFNYYGYSRIAPAYEAWYNYHFTHFMRARHVEQDADPALQVWYPPGTFLQDGETKNNRDVALEIGALLRGGATIAWPSDVHIDEDGKATTQKMWEAAFLTGGENTAAFNEVLNDLRVEMMRACLVPEEALIEALRGTGSRASSGNRMELFTESMAMVASNLDDIRNRYQIRPVVEANWGADAPPCKVRTSGFQEEDLTLVNELIQIAFNLDPNALPIKFEELLERANLPQYSKQEQEEREQAALEAQQEQEAAAAEQAAAAGGQLPPGAPGAGGGGEGVGPLPGETPEELAASQQRDKPRKYERQRVPGDLRLSQTTAPGWARREGKRRDRNVAALAERMQDVIEARYRDAFDAAAEAVAELDDNTLRMAVAEVGPELDLSQETHLELALKDTVLKILDKIVGGILDRVSGYKEPIQGELASMYHATGAAELQRLGLSADSWDVGRDEVQEWARWRAGELIKTIDKTVVEKHIRPWLASGLQNLGQQDRQGVPYGALELAQQLTEKFEKYPQWMAERVVRTEARIGYNESAADMWERIGIEEVEEYDGLGGKTGKTDEDCLARNGRVVSIDEFREDNRKEHPNGTLGARPVAVGVTLKPLEPGVIQDRIYASASLYGVTDAGFILSQEEVGKALAG